MLQLLVGEAKLLDLLRELACQVVEVEGAHGPGQALHGRKRSVRSTSCHAGISCDHCNHGPALTAN